MRAAAAAAALAACVLAAVGCGDSGERASTPTPTPTPTATANRPEAEPGGAGDEQPIRQPVPLTIGDDGITPKLSKVSAFLGLELVIRNESSREQVVTVLRARPKRAVSIGAGETGRLRLDGLGRGRYTIQGYAAGRATLVSSVDEP
jgi:hypothetical protein